jgi:hypothetical protein
LLITFVCRALGTFNAGQAMRGIKPIITEVKLAAVDDKPSDPERAIP